MFLKLFLLGWPIEVYHLFGFLVISNERFATAIALTALPNMLSWLSLIMNCSPRVKRVLTEISALQFHI